MIWSRKKNTNKLIKVEKYNGVHLIQCKRFTILKKNILLQFVCLKHIWYLDSSNEMNKFINIHLFSLVQFSFLQENGKGILNIEVFKNTHNQLRELNLWQFQSKVWRNIIPEGKVHCLHTMNVCFIFLYIIEGQFSKVVVLVQSNISKHSKCYYKDICKCSNTSF